MRDTCSTGMVDDGRHVAAKCVCSCTITRAAALPVLAKSMASQAPPLLDTLLQGRLSGLLVHPAKMPHLHRSVDIDTCDLVSQQSMALSGTQNPAICLELVAALSTWNGDHPLMHKHTPIHACSVRCVMLNSDAVLAGP